MKTETLIRMLAADAGPIRPLSARLAMALVPATLLALAALWLTMGFRPDVLSGLWPEGGLATVNLHPPLRIALTALLGLLGVRLSLLLARPEGWALARLWPLAAVAAVAAGLLVWSLATTPAAAVPMAVAGKTLTACLVMIPILSVLPVAAILVTLRAGAVTVPGWAGFAAGIGGGGLAAAIYALHCTEDSPLFYVTWSATAILGIALLSALAGRRLLRW